MDIKTISVLPIEEIRVIKQIMIVSEFANNKEYSIGYILYERELSDNYKFKETPKGERDFSYYLDFPRQDSYPTDNLDEIILQSIKNSFPKSTLRNYSLICNVDKERIERLQNRQFEQSEISFTPDFSQTDFHRFVGQSFDGLRKPIKIYNDFTKESIQNLYFQGYYNLNDRQMLDRIDSTKFI